MNSLVNSVILADCVVLRRTRASRANSGIQRISTIVNNHEPGSRFIFTRSIYNITYSLLEKYGHEKIIATLLYTPTIEYYDP